jgi:hypothetical protein
MAVPLYPNHRKRQWRGRQPLGTWATAPHPRSSRGQLFQFHDRGPVEDAEAWLVVSAPTGHIRGARKANRFLCRATQFRCSPTPPSQLHDEMSAMS